MTTKDEWFTPKRIVEAARAALGGIDLDPASTAAANRTVAADEFYTLADNGLARSWAGRVWLNPPYSRPEPWMDRLIYGWRTGDVPVGVTILTATSALGTEYGARLLEASRLIVFPGRVRFLTPDGSEGESPRDASVLIAGGESLNASWHDSCSCSPSGPRPAGTPAAALWPYPAGVGPILRSARYKRPDSLCFLAMFGPVLSALLPTRGESASRSGRP